MLVAGIKTRGITNTGGGIATPAEDQTSKATLVGNRVDPGGQGHIGAAQVPCRAREITVGRIIKGLHGQVRGGESRKAVNRLRTGDAITSK